MKKLKCLIFIDADIICRHFLDSNIFKDLIKNHEVEFIFPEKGNKRMGNVNVDLLYPDIIKHYVDHKPYRLKLWRQLLFTKQLKFSLNNKSKSLRNHRRQTLKWKAATLFTFLGLPIIWFFFKKIQFLKLRNNSNHILIEKINKFGPDLIIHPSVLEGLFINDLVLISNQNKIPLIVIMNSWDNPSTKSAVVGNPDWLLVWGQQTYNHSIEYLNMNKSRVIQFGCAQFDIYKSKKTININIIKKLYNVKKSEKILLYAGSSKGTDEIKHLNLIDKAIDNHLIKNIKVIYRPHPWGNGGKNGERLIDQKWNNIKIDSNMIKYLTDLKEGKNYKYLSDYKDTHNILSNVDMVISPLSTILIEAALHGKPSVCFLPYSDKSKHFKIDSDLVHFQEFFRNKNFLKAYGYEELISSINKLINVSHKKNIKNIMRNEANYYVKTFEKSFSIRLNEFIKNIV